GHQAVYWRTNRPKLSPIVGCGAPENVYAWFVHSTGVASTPSIRIDPAVRLLTRQMTRCQRWVSPISTVAAFPRPPQRSAIVGRYDWPAPASNRTAGVSKTPFVSAHQTAPPGSSNPQQRTTQTCVHVFEFHTAPASGRARQLEPAPGHR